MAGSAAQKSAHLPGVLAGETIVALAADEGSHHAPDRVATTARAEGGGFVLDGRKTGDWKLQSDDIEALFAPLPDKLEKR